MTHEPHEPREPGSDAPDPTAGSPQQLPDQPPRVTFRGRRNPRRFYLGWPVLAAIGAGIGFLTGGLPGLFVGGVLGFLIWRLR